MNKLGFVALLASVTAAFVGCQSQTVPSPAKPTLVDITGNGRWTRASGNNPDMFGFALGAAEECPAGGPSMANCPQRYPDTAFIDFDIPSLTNFTVDSGGAPFTLVGSAAPMGDFQYRRSQLNDGSGATTRWRIAVAVPANVVQSPAKARTWCPVTTFPINIVDEAGGTRSAPLPVQLVWGKCVPPPSPTIFWASPGGSSGPSGTPASNPPNPPQGDCPGGAVAKAFLVCERCGTSGLATEKTFWGCSLTDATTKFGNAGCVSALRTGPNC
jgi:hypothetical protein